MEIWKLIEGFESYAVSNLGRIKNKDGTIKRQTKIRNGYMNVDLYKNGIRKHLCVHRLVATAFLNKPNHKKMETNHLNGIKNDNRVENLEWCTRSENLQHSYDFLGRQAPRGEACKKAILTKQDVLRIRNLYTTGNYTYGEIADKFRVAIGTIGDVIRKSTWKHI